MTDVVVDTSVFVADLRSTGGASRQILRLCLRGDICPLFGNALWAEYEDVLSRPGWTNETSGDERRAVLAALAQIGRWVKIFYGWRPNLSDESDNHLIELAIAGQARAIITHNVRDLRGGELAWKSLAILTPAEFLENAP